MPFQVRSRKPDDRAGGIADATCALVSRISAEAICARPSDWRIPTISFGTSPRRWRVCAPPSDPRSRRRVIDTARRAQRRPRAGRRLTADRRPRRRPGQSSDASGGHRHDHDLGGPRRPWPTCRHRRDPAEGATGDEGETLRLAGSAARVRPVAQTDQGQRGSAMSPGTCPEGT
jgi:hypothetical protein